MKVADDDNSYEDGGNGGQVFQMSTNARELAEEMISVGRLSNLNFKCNRFSAALNTEKFAGVPE